MRLPDGWMSSYEWEGWMECIYDEMPEWYSNVNLREDAYTDYIKGIKYDCHILKRAYKDTRKDRLKKYL